MNQSVHDFCEKFPSCWVNSDIADNGNCTMAGQWHWLHSLQPRHVVSRCCHAARDMTPWPEQVSWHRHVMSSSHVVMSYKYLKKYDLYLICCLEKSHAETVKYEKWEEAKILNISVFLILKIKFYLHSSHQELVPSLRPSLTFNLTFYDMNKHDQNKVIKVHIVTVTNVTPLCMTEYKLLALNSVLCIGFYK